MITTIYNCIAQLIQPSSLKIIAKIVVTIALIDHNFQNTLFTILFTYICLAITSLSLLRLKGLFTSIELKIVAGNLFSH